MKPENLKYVVQLYLQISTISKRLERLRAQRDEAFARADSHFYAQLRREAREASSQLIATTAEMFGFSSDVVSYWLNRLHAVDTSAPTPPNARGKCDGCHCH